MRFSDLEYVPAKLTPELPDVQARAARALERLAVAGPLRYLGAGASAVVFVLDDEDVVLKVARLGPPGSRYRKEIERQKRADFFSEAEYIMDAMDRDLPVAGLANIARPAFLRDEVVIVKDFVAGKPGNMGTRGLHDLWAHINIVMDLRWGPVEFKEENFIVPRIVNTSPVLVDAGGAIRRGQNLLDHASAVARGVFDDPDADLRGPTHEESYLRWSLRMDAQDGRIELEDANRVIAELDARFGTPRRLNPAKPGWKPCKLLADHTKVLEDDALWASWPLVGRDASMGIETRRCPVCHSTQSRPLEGNPKRRVYEAKGQRDDTPPGEVSTMYLCEECLPGVDDFFVIESKKQIATICDRCGADGSTLSSMAMPAGGYVGRIEIPPKKRRRRR